MDLAESIRENTAAVQALTAALQSFSVPADKPKKARPPVEAAPPAPPPAPAPEPEAPALDVATIKAAATKLAAQSRDALVAVLDKYGAKKFSEVKPEDFAAFYADVKAAT